MGVVFDKDEQTGDLMLSFLASKRHVVHSFNLVDAESNLEVLPNSSTWWLFMKLVDDLYLNVLERSMSFSTAHQRY